MVYNTFLTTIKEALQTRLGDGYGVVIQKIPKNNGTMLDGLCISKTSDRVAPTIYLRAYYEHLLEGTSLEEILEEILDVYQHRTGLPQIHPDLLNHFEHLRKKVVYKLIHTDSNRELLKSLPSIPYLDLSIVFYLFLEENEYGHMTALIHKNHMVSWNTTTEELYRLASDNTPKLLPADLKSMAEVMREIAMEQLGEDYQEDFIQELLFKEGQSPLFVLTNRSGLNGACAILYKNQLKNFADMLGQELVILPSSIHEVLLIPYDDDLCFDELSEMVTHINRTEVPTEDQLSNQVYLYSRSLNQVSIVPVAARPSHLS